MSPNVRGLRRTSWKSISAVLKMPVLQLFWRFPSTSIFFPLQGDTIFVNYHFGWLPRNIDTASHQFTRFVALLKDLKTG